MPEPNLPTAFLNPASLKPARYENCHEIIANSQAIADGQTDFSYQTRKSSAQRSFTFKRRESLPVYAQHLWLIERGAVRAYTLMEDGTILGLGFWGVGDSVGQHLSCIQPYELECLTDVQARAIALKDFVDWPQTLLSHLYQAQALINIRNGQVHLRLRRLLEWLSERFGEKHEQGRLINLRLTHQDMADALGTTRVTVTRLLNQFEQERRIRRVEQYLLLLQGQSVQGESSLKRW